MYLDMGNMKSYNKSYGCEQPSISSSGIEKVKLSNFLVHLRLR